MVLSYLARSNLFETPPNHATTHVVADGSTISERLTATLAREGFVSIRACTEPIGTGIGGVYFQHGRPKCGRLRC